MTFIYKLWTCDLSKCDT